MRISDFLAQTITQRRALVWSSVALLTVACIAIMSTSMQLDSEIFNVLPGKFSSVKGLKIYDRDFEQTRELTFALQCDPKDVDKLDEFAPVFAERLRQQPWCTRVLAGSPMSAPDGIRDLQSIAVPLLLNLEPNAFRETIAVLQPEKIRDRLHRLREQIEAGSPRPEFELSFDPLGLIAPALKPFADSMISVGFCAILVGLGVDFSILTIGRYHQARSDGELHRQAIATSIAKLGRAIFFGALTTAVGFLALVLSGSMAFSQLGVLIAIGIFVAGLFMCSILFLFVRERQAIPHDWLFESVRKYVRWIVRKPVPMLLFSTVLLLVLTAIGFSPNPPLHFETNTRSLQPRNIRASQALEAIMHEMPVRWEPVLAIVRSANPQELHDYWQKIVAHWRGLQAAGKIKGFSTPAALCLSPDWMETNRRQLSAINFLAARETLDQTLDAEGFSRDSFAPAFTLLDDLKRLTDPNVPLPNWRDQLPKSSSWWFLVDRYFGHDPALTTGFVTTNQPISAHAQSKDLERDLQVPEVPMILSGWSYALADLLPWSHHQLLLISALMAIFDISLLALLYRDFRLWTIQLITLAFGIGAMIASMKLLHINLNLLNVLSFRLVLAIGVDYGIYVVLVWQKTREIEHDVAGVLKPVLLAGLTAVSGFGSLTLARNPALTSLGIACAIGIFWSLMATIFFALPAMAANRPKT